MFSNLICPLTTVTVSATSPYFLTLLFNSTQAYVGPYPKENNISQGMSLMSY